MLKTDYVIGEIPHPEHPEPQRRRESWLNLNGKWAFAKSKIGVTPESLGEILVPFSPESENSGVGGDFKLNADEQLIYCRRFDLGDDMLLGATHLHFGAVDSYARVFVNGELAGEHECGYTPFTLDVSALVKKGENEIAVIVHDNFKHGARGKQNEKRGGIWYTPQSGIWQTVWLESMPVDYIRDLRYEFDVTQKKAVVYACSNGKTQTLRVFDDGTEIFAGDFLEEISVSYDFELWSPESPKLYDVIIENECGDRLTSYFGFRTFGVKKDGRGKKRLTLNGKPYFMSGVLDQGYWSDGLLTHPNDKALVDELTMLKEMGFNTIRKHIKVEPMRWYYHCDRLGFIVWQDFVNGGGDYKFTHIAAFPFLGFKHKDDDYKYFARENERGRKEFKRMAADTVDRLYNCTCVGLWVIFNEGWGQFDSFDFVRWLKERDPSRIIDSVSGWHDQGKDKTTLLSLHTYYTPLKVPKDERAVVLSEFGGYSMKVSGHVFDESKEFGYKRFRTKRELHEALERLFILKLKPLIAKGLSASIYTQVSDVEEEINGLVTYDRKVEKVDRAFMKYLNSSLYRENEKLL